MNRIDKTLAALRTHNKKMLSPYITAGDPDAKTTVALMHALVEAGADVLEIGIPFSDPMAEGPVIQAAMERALAQNICCDDIFAMIKQFRSTDAITPIVLMGYVNPVECYGYEAFAQAAENAGVDGLILVDMPPEESEDTKNIWASHHIHRIFLCSPTTSDARMNAINQYGKGYLYYVSLKGVTGSSALQIDAVQTDYRRRKQQTQLPVMVGFGIKTAETAAAIAQFSDGVVVGAALINDVYNATLNNNDPSAAAKALIGGMRAAMDASGNQDDRSN